MLDNVTDKSILIVDDNAEILEIVHMAVESVFSGKILTATSVASAKSLLEKNEKPILIISDFSLGDGTGADLYNFVIKKYPSMEFYICSGDPVDHIKQQIPQLKKIITKPNIFQPLQAATTEYLNGLNLTNALGHKEYVAVRVSILLRLGFISYDLFMKLSDKKYVKISHKDTEFDPETARKYLQKKIVFLYLHFQEAHLFVREFQKSLDLFSKNQNIADSQLFEISQESYEATVNIVSVFGWSKDAKKMVKKSTAIAVRALAKNENLRKLLQNLSESRDQYLAMHTHMVATVACGIAKTLQWDSDYTNVKICMAALMHDIALRNISYEQVMDLDNTAKSQNSGEVSEITLYRKHPEEAVALLVEIDDIPPDVDKIILQHHECPDGSGFPHQLQHLQISPLAAVFILSQDLVDFCFKKTVTKELMEDFFKSRREYYNRGHYKKAFKALVSSLS